MQSIRREKKKKTRPTQPFHKEPWWNFIVHYTNLGFLCSQNSHQTSFQMIEVPIQHSTLVKLSCLGDWNIGLHQG